MQAWLYIQCLPAFIFRKAHSSLGSTMPVLCNSSYMIAAVPDRLRLRASSWGIPRICWDGSWCCCGNAWQLGWFACVHIVKCDTCKSQKSDMLRRMCRHLDVCKQQAQLLSNQDVDSSFITHNPLAPQIIFLCIFDVRVYKVPASKHFILLRWF